MSDRSEIRAELRRLRSRTSPFPETRSARIAEDEAMLEMSARDLRSALHQRGCVELRQKGSHVQVKCGNCQSTVPVHGNKDIKRGTLGGIERSLAACVGRFAR